MGETGESTTATFRRMDDAAWPRVLKLLRGGAVLFRPTKMRDYYTWPARPGAPYVEAMGLTATRVKNLASDGVLLNIGVDRYGLNPDWTEPAPEPVAPVVRDDHPDLFGSAA